MILKYDQTKYKISTYDLEEAIKRIKKGNKYINNLENEILYYKIKINKAIEYTKILREKYFKECVAGSSYELGELISILEGGSNE